VGGSTCQLLLLLLLLVPGRWRTTCQGSVFIEQLLQPTQK
jgi:hypothetical protein